MMVCVARNGRARRRGARGAGAEADLEVDSIAVYDDSVEVRGMQGEFMTNWLSISMPRFRYASLWDRYSTSDFCLDLPIHHQYDESGLEPT